MGLVVYCRALKCILTKLKNNSIIFCDNKSGGFGKNEKITDMPELSGKQYFNILREGRGGELFRRFLWNILSFVVSCEMRYRIFHSCVL